MIKTRVRKHKLVFKAISQVDTIFVGEERNKQMYNLARKGVIAPKIEEEKL